jgi:DNA-binding SARP family transcriptional activator
VEFRLLGPLEVAHDGRLLEIGGVKERALLAILLLNANHAVPVDRLIDDLWGDEPAESAKNSLQVRVSNVRKALRSAAPDVIATVPPGYLARLGSEQLDLHRFERLHGEGEQALARHEAELAAELLREALSLWRGPALAEFATEPFARAASGRLEELRLLALERRIEADLELGRDAGVVAELEALAAEYPYRESLYRLQMLALYRSGRQADALAAFRRVRRMFVEELGIEPSSMLQELEHAILRHDSALELASPPPPARSILVVSLADGPLDALLALVEPLARRPAHGLVIVRPLAVGEDLGGGLVPLAAECAALRARGFAARHAAFTSSAPGEDVARIAAEQDVDLLVVGGATELFEDGALAAVLTGALCDVAVLLERETPPGTGSVLVPFTGAEHDWAAVELAAWIAVAGGSSLLLAGPEADAAAGTRDASRLLAHASLAVQRAFGVAAEPLLVPPTAAGLLRAADESALVVLGLPDGWRRDGLGPVRGALAREARPPALLVRHGIRPGGLAPRDSLTRYTWSLRT